jgi:BlaI family penicillinase repressor
MEVMRKDVPLLTRAEAEVMQVLWRTGAATVQQVVNALARPLAYNTVLTVLRILIKKGYVLSKPDPASPRAYQYEAALREGPVRIRHARDLVERLFGGRADALVTGLVEHEDLSRHELNRLRKLINERLAKKPKKEL